MGLELQRRDIFPIRRPAVSAKGVRSRYDLRFAGGQIQPVNPAALRFLAGHVAINDRFAVCRPTWPTLVVVAFSGFLYWAAIAVDEKNPPWPIVFPPHK